MGIYQMWQDLYSIRTKQNQKPHFGFRNEIRKKVCKRVVRKEQQKCF